MLKGESTFQDAQYAHKGLVAHQFVKQLLVACIENDLNDLKKNF